MVASYLSGHSTTFECVFLELILSSGRHGWW